MRKVDNESQRFSYSLTDLSNLKGMVGEYVALKFLKSRGFRILCWNGALLLGLRLAIPTKKVKKLVSVEDYLELENSPFDIMAVDYVKRGKYRRLGRCYGIQVKNGMRARLERNQEKALTSQKERGITPVVLYVRGNIIKNQWNLTWVEY
ncbi:MAG: hypothetical protein HYU39_04035 [Thaumarchaeota archaeon]|nr:hypothetical protein [Nitrososphaerota archaeon]